jgi:hypothetical protein
MPRPSNWNSPTTAIRVPTHCAEQLLEIARALNREFCTKPSDHSQDLTPEWRLITIDDQSTMFTAPKSIWLEADRIAKDFLETFQAEGGDLNQLKQAVVQLMEREFFPESFEARINARNRT